MVFFFACGGLFSLVKHTFRDLKTAKFSACGGLFPFVKYTFRSRAAGEKKMVFWVPNVGELTSCGGINFTPENVGGN